MQSAYNWTTNTCKARPQSRSRSSPRASSQGSRRRSPEANRRPQSIALAPSVTHELSSTKKPKSMKTKKKHGEQTGNDTQRGRCVLDHVPEGQHKGAVEQAALRRGHSRTAATAAPQARPLSSPASGSREGTTSITTCMNCPTWSSAQEVGASGKQT